MFMDSVAGMIVSGVTGVITALITSLFVCYSAKKRRSIDSVLKISEFRHQWINDLRETMAEFQSYGVLPNGDPTKKRAFYRLGTKIELLMNRNDEDYEPLHDMLEAFYDKASAPDTEKFDVDEKYVAICQRILKREWDRLKFKLGESIG